MPIIIIQTKMAQNQKCTLIRLKIKRIICNLITMIMMIHSLNKHCLLLKTMVNLIIDVLVVLINKEQHITTKVNKTLISKYLIMVLAHLFNLVLKLQQALDPLIKVQVVTLVD